MEIGRGTTGHPTMSCSRGRHGEVGTDLDRSGQVGTVGACNYSAL